MQEIKKRRIVIASVLKPVDDTRMFEKIGRSLATTYEVHVIGFPASSTSTQQDVTQHTITSRPFKRLSLTRFLAPWKVFRLSLSLRPDVVIICTHELLLPSLLGKLLLPNDLIYDIQENYYNNIYYSAVFPSPLKQLLAAWVRIKERITAGAIKHFFLAEEAYTTELPFLDHKFTVLENKYKALSGSVPARKQCTDRRINLLFSGTLAESTGVFTAIRLATALQALEPRVLLTIIGYCSRPQEYAHLIDQINDKPFIRLIGGNSLVPHHEILAHVAASDFGIIAYPPNPATATATPTKLYEYLANTLPILLIDNPRWIKICDPFTAAIPFNPGQLKGEELLHAMKTTPFYSTTPTDVRWESEERKLLAVVNSLNYQNK